MKPMTRFKRNLINYCKVNVEINQVRNWKEYYMKVEPRNSLMKAIWWTAWEIRDYYNIDDFQFDIKNRFLITEGKEIPIDTILFEIDQKVFNKKMA